MKITFADIPEKLEKDMKDRKDREYRGIAGAFLLQDREDDETVVEGLFFGDFSINDLQKMRVAVMQILVNIEKELLK